MQPHQGIGHQAELVGDRPQLLRVAAREVGPGVLGGCDALARLGQQGRVEQAELGFGVVDRLVRVDPVGTPDGRQRLCIDHGPGRGLRTEEQQILRQALGNGVVAACQRGVLQQHTGGRAFGVDVQRQQAERKRLRIGGGELPEHARLQVGLAGCKTQRHVAQLQRGAGVAAAHDAQHTMVECGAGVRGIGLGGGCRQCGGGIGSPTAHREAETAKAHRG